MVRIGFRGRYFSANPVSFKASTNRAECPIMPYSIHIDFPVFLSRLFRRVYGILRQKLAWYTMVIVLLWARTNVCSIPFCSNSLQGTHKKICVRILCGNDGQSCSVCLNLWKTTGYFGRKNRFPKTIVPENRVRFFIEKTFLIILQMNDQSIGTFSINFFGVMPYFFLNSRWK